MTPDANAVYLSANASAQDISDAMDSGRDVLFAAGAVYRLEPDQSLWIRSGGTAANPRVIGVHGQGPRPRFEATGRAPVIHCIAGNTPQLQTPINHLIIQGLELTYPARNPGHASYDPSLDDKTCWGVRWVRPGDHVVIEDCEVSWFWQGIAMSGDARLGRRAPDHLTLRRNIIHHNWSDENLDRALGVYIDPSKTGQVVFEDNVLHANGWLESRPLTRLTLQSHNLYIDDAFTRYFPEQGSAAPTAVRGNFFGRGAATGAKIHPGGVIEDNVFWRNAEAFLFSGNDSFIRRNVCMEGEDFHPNSPTGNENFWRRGTGFYTNGTDRTPRMRRLVVEDNLLARRLGVGGNPIHLDCEEVEFRRNVVFDWATGWHQYGESYRSWWLLEDSVDRLQMQSNIGTGSGQRFFDATRGLGTYHQALGLAGPSSDDALIQQMIARPRGQWPVNLSPERLSTYLRAGFSPLPFD